MKTLKQEELNKINAYFRAANYLSVGQLYLKDNPLLKRELTLDDVKKHLVGHWGTAPGQNFVYVHLNRIINKYDLNMIYISGPGHGGQAMVANTYLEGSYSEIYPNISEDEEGMKKLFKQFSFPGGISSHVAPETPGSINEGGELGYSLAHAFGAVLDNPTLIAATVVGDGEAETGPLAASWQLNKIINPKSDGVVLPILHLNGYKISNPTILSRISEEELVSYFNGMGWDPYIVGENDTESMHQSMAYALDKCIQDINYIKKCKKNVRISYPMIILKTPKGWGGPKIIDNNEIEGTFRAHQIPMLVDSEHIENLKTLEAWMKSYKPWELFDDNGKLIDSLKALAPKGDRRMGKNPNANGGLLLEDLKMPDFREYATKFDKPGTVIKEDMRELGKFVRDIVKLNENEKNFRIFGPDEALSNRLNHVFEYANRKWDASIIEGDEYLSNSGTVFDSYLSETFCEGLLEGYLLTGRHGFIHSYEAFIRIIDSMVSQHAKWLKECHELPWRKSIGSLNIILTSHVWQQDHNGYTHQNPGFLNHIVNYKSDIVRMYFPIDANTLLSTFDHIIKTKDYINVVVASKHKSLQWMSMKEASIHCKNGLGILEFASNKPKNPDIVLASCGDTPNLEVIAASTILKERVPKLKTRVVNVIDLMRLESNYNHPHGLTDKDFDNIFTKDKPVIFAFHGYPVLIHQLVYKRNNQNFHVHGYIEEGTITTPFDMRVQNKIDRYNLVIDALSYVDQTKEVLECIEYCYDQLKKHKKYIKEHGVDMNEILDFSL